MAIYLLTTQGLQARFPKTPQYPWIPQRSNLENDTRNRRGAVPRNPRTTNNVNPGQGERNNPPGGMQKRLNRMARSQGGQPRAPPSISRDRTKPWALDAKDKSNDTCHRCNQTGHWANECTQIQGKKRTWSDVVAGGSGTIGTVLPSATASTERPVLLPNPAKN